MKTPTTPQAPGTAELTAAIAERGGHGQQRGSAVYHSPSDDSGI
jgi:hypothetical protein